MPPDGAGHAHEGNYVPGVPHPNEGRDPVSSGRAGRPEPRGRETDVADYLGQSWWPRESLGELVRQRAARTPDGVAYYAEHGPLTWASYDQRAQALAGQLAPLGLAPGGRGRVYLPASPVLH